jgi:hypothetical protein
MKTVAWGFSLPALSEALARELAKLPGRVDLRLQIDPETRTIDFSSVRIAEFLRTDFTQLETLVRAMEKEHGVIVVFDMWRFVFGEAFESSLELIMKVAQKSARCLLLSPARFTHVDELVLRSDARVAKTRDPTEWALMEKWVTRVRVLHEAVLNSPNHVSLVTSAPPVELFWSLLGVTSLQPARVLGFSAAPSDLRKESVTFSNFAGVAKECARLVSAGNSDFLPWEHVPGAVDLSWPEKSRALECGWDRYVEFLSSRSKAPVPCFARSEGRATLARFLHLMAVRERRGDVAVESGVNHLGLLFPSGAEAVRPS